ncbi:hypothetical protein SteCoe_12491 [Stentor coeruleus]|uniref:Uncharacterized protein n=1 Tax=Stentor coeruleus TaxID=5963 RepID=A0A1R2CAQ1_9CILI|nr:hypothetical protein SteCoe_12491 [Stentor coeruleus]
MGCCNCITKDTEIIIDQMIGKFEESSCTTANKSNISSIKPLAKPTLFFVNDITYNSCIDEDCPVMKLPDIGSENSIASWRHHGSPDVLI